VFPPKEASVHYASSETQAHSHCNTLQSHYDTLQHTAIALRHTATHCNTLQHTATHCNTLQHTATHCNTLQHFATLRNNPQHSATYAVFNRPWALTHFAENTGDFSNILLQRAKFLKCQLYRSHRVLFLMGTAALCRICSTGLR